MLNEQFSIIHVELKGSRYTCRLQQTRKGWFWGNIPRKRNGFSAQGGDGLSSKRFRIITEEENYKWATPSNANVSQNMASYANDNSDNNIPEKDVKEAILIKTPTLENLDQVKKLENYLQGLLKQKEGHKILIQINP